MPPTWTNLLLALLPPEPFMDLVYGLNLFLASVFLIAFLRRRSLGWPACVGGAFTAYWLGSNLTLLLPGHLEKFAVLLFAAVTLYALDRTLDERGVRWSLLSGGTLGMMFMHQPDLALFFGLLLGAFFLHGLITRVGKRPGDLARCALPLWLPALMLVGESYQTAMDTQVRDVAILQEGNVEEKWSFTTQWSWPPGESLDLIAPGYFGWFTGHPEVPYHGVMGRDARFEATGRGLMNFKRESPYIGALPLGFAIVALCLVAARKRKGLLPGDTGFWILAAIITFILACGKFTPFYRLFQALPLVDAIRNPNKFLQVFQMTLGILAAYGINAWRREAFSPRARRVAAGAFLAVALTAGLGSLLTAPADPVQQASLPEGFQDLDTAPALLRARQRALLHLALFAGAGAGLVAVSIRPSLRRWAPVALIPLFAVDSLLLGRIYLQPDNISFLKTNVLADRLTQNLSTGRVALMETSGVYGYYLTHLFPAHHIPFAHISVAPRLEEDYRAYFERRTPDPNGLLPRIGLSPLPVFQGAWVPLTAHEDIRARLDFLAVARHQFRYWRDFGVDHVLATRPVAEFAQRLPGGDSLKQIFSYDLMSRPDGGIGLIPRPDGNHVALARTAPSSRFTLIGNWMETDKGVRLADDWVPGTAGRVTSAIPEPDGFRLTVEVDAPRALLRLADRWDPALFARVNDGDPIPLRRVDGLFAGLILPEGAHEINLGFHRPSPGRTLQKLGIALTLLAGSACLAQRIKD